MLSGTACTLRNKQHMLSGLSHAFDHACAAMRISGTSSSGSACLEPPSSTLSSTPVHFNRKRLSSSSVAPLKSQQCCMAGMTSHHYTPETKLTNICDPQATKEGSASKRATPFMGSTHNYTPGLARTHTPPPQLQPPQSLKGTSPAAAQAMLLLLLLLLLLWHRSRSTKMIDQLPTAIHQHTQYNHRCRGVDPLPPPAPATVPLLLRLLPRTPPPVDPVSDCRLLPGCCCPAAAAAARLALAAFRRCFCTLLLTSLTSFTTPTPNASPTPLTVVVTVARRSRLGGGAMPASAAAAAAALPAGLSAASCSRAAVGSSWLLLMVLSASSRGVGP